MAKPLLVVAATLLFFAGGIGVRWIGVPPLWTALRGRMPENTMTWRILGWTTLCGIAIPFVLVTEPYNDTLQFYQTGLYVLWLFTAAGLSKLVGGSRTRGAAAIVLALAASLPSSVHYLNRRWTDADRPALVGLTRIEMDMASYLRGRDPDTTVVLNDRPLEPSLMAVLSERRTVLAWGRYAVGSNERQREVDAFYGSTREIPRLMDILSKHHVTHVVVHTNRDRVNPQVLDQLKLVMGDGVVNLYEVEGRK